MSVAQRIAAALVTLDEIEDVVAQNTPPGDFQARVDNLVRIYCAYDLGADICRSIDATGAV